jgi:hypothetical protein
MKPNGIVDHATRILPSELRKTIGYPYKKYMFFRYLKKSGWGPVQAAGPRPDATT